MRFKRKTLILAVFLILAISVTALASGGAPTSQFGFKGWPYRQSTNCGSVLSSQSCSGTQCPTQGCTTQACETDPACQAGNCPSNTCGAAKCPVTAAKPTPVAESEPTATPAPIATEEPAPAPTEVAAEAETTPEPTSTCITGTCPLATTPKPAATPKPTVQPAATSKPTAKPTVTPKPTTTCPTGTCPFATTPAKPTATNCPTGTCPFTPTSKPAQQILPTPTPTCETGFCPLHPNGTLTPTQTPAQTPKPTATPKPSTGGDYTTPSVTSQEQIAFQLLNQDRQNNGRGALTLDPALCSLARLKSSDMNANKYFAHTSPTLGSAADMLRNYGYAFTSVGENIAHHATVEKSQAAFMSSTGHRTNILGSQWKKVGIGVSYDSQGFVYVTQLFVR